MRRAAATAATPRRRSPASSAARDPQVDTSVGTLFTPEGLDGLVTPGADFVRVKARAGAETVVPMEQVAWICNRRV